MLKRHDGSTYSNNSFSFGVLPKGVDDAKSSVSVTVDAFLPHGGGEIITCSSPRHNNVHKALQMCTMPKALTLLKTGGTSISFARPHAAPSGDLAVAENGPKGDCNAAVAAVDSKAETSLVAEKPVDQPIGASAPSMARFDLRTTEDCEIQATLAAKMATELSQGYKMAGMFVAASAKSAIANGPDGEPLVLFSCSAQEDLTRVSARGGREEAQHKDLLATLFAEIGAKDADKKRGPGALLKKMFLKTMMSAAGGSPADTILFGTRLLVSAIDRSANGNGTKPAIWLNPSEKFGFAAVGAASPDFLRVVLPRVAAHHAQIMKNNGMAEKIQKEEILFGTQNAQMVSLVQHIAKELNLDLSRIVLPT